MEHLDSNCPCHPMDIPVVRLNGTIGWVVAHKEPDQTPEQEAERAIRIFEGIDQVRNTND